MTTLQQLAKEAINVQDACNLSGVAHSFSRVVSDLRALDPNIDTDTLNHHPIVVMWVSKLASLSDSEGGVSFHNAYNKVSDWSEGTAR